MLQRVRTLLERRAKPLPDRTRRLLLTVATVGIIAAMGWAWDRADLTFDDLAWQALLGLALIAAPASLGLKAAEFIVAARVAGQHPPRRLAMETAVVSSAANLLPLPGSLMVTVQTLAEGGATYGGAVAASAIPGAAWLGITGLIGGVAQFAMTNAYRLGAVSIIAPFA